MPDLFHKYPNVTVDDKDPKHVTRNIERVRTILSPFFLRRLKSEVSQHLPKKEMKILYCDMAENQQKCYQECIKSSRKYWNMDQADISKVISPTSASKLRGDQDDEDIDQLVDDDFGPPSKSKSKSASAPPEQTLFNNIFMQLRKVSNHPLLSRYIYDDAKIKEIATTLFKADPRPDYPVSFWEEDMKINSDFQIHNTCSLNPKLHHLALTQEQLESSGKAIILKSLLEQLHAEGHRVLLFSQMTK